MPAKIIASVNQKGGSAKTTATMQLAGTLALRGKKVLVMDCDAQYTAHRWAHANRKKPFPAQVEKFVHKDGDGNARALHADVRAHYDSFDYIFLDCPPSIESAIPQTALLIADLALIPVVPSPNDLWAVAGAVKLIETIQPHNPTLKSLMVPCCYHPNRTLPKMVMSVLAGYGIPIADSHLTYRSAYQECAAHGQTVHMFGARGRPAIQEVESLTDEIIRLVGAPATRKSAKRKGDRNGKA